MEKIKPCPVCGKVPKLGYACGEYFISGDDYNCPACGRNGYGAMTSNPDRMVEMWNGWCIYYGKDH